MPLVSKEPFFSITTYLSLGREGAWLGPPVTLTVSGFILYLDFYRETLAQANVGVAGAAKGARQESDFWGSFQNLEKKCMGGAL